MIKRIFLLVVTLGVVAGVFLWPKPKPPEQPKAEVVPEDALEIVLHYQPGGTGSEQMVTILDKAVAKYGGKQVHLTKVDAKTHPEVSKSQGVKKLPHVIFNAKKSKVFEFQGNWSQAQVEFKVEEILRGLKRVDKDWRPPVPGMTPAEN